MKELTVAGLSIAISAALEFSDIGGPLASGIAWAVAIAIVVLLLGRRLRDRRGSGERTLGGRSQGLGNELVVFIRKRMVETPTMTGARMSMGMVKAVFGRDQSDRRRVHDADTMSIYFRLYARQVRGVIREFLSVGLIGEEEARTLVTPESPGQIERLGQRLIQLSCHVG